MRDVLGVVVAFGLGVSALVFRLRRPNAPALGREYSTTVLIAAPAEVVWRALTDAGGYAAWNPEVIGIDGQLGPNASMKARVKLGDGAIRTVPLRVSAFLPASRMEWTGGLPLGLFVGRRAFAVSPTEGGASFRMHLSMTGPLAPMIIKSVGDRQAEVDSFSAALKARAESLAAS